MKSLLLALAAVPWLCQAQTPLTDAASGITFDTYTEGGITIGIALPADGLKNNASEYIGLLTCPSSAGQGVGWCGISHGGAMTNDLLLLAYPEGDQILTSFRFATGYRMPDLYTGNAQLTQVSSSVNATHYSLIYRCLNCLSWDQDGAKGSVSTSEGNILLGWALSNTSPTNATCSDYLSLKEHTSQGIFSFVFTNSTPSSSYPTWAEKATTTVTCASGSSTATGTATATGTSSGTASATATATTTAPPVPTSSQAVPTGVTYDYIVVGAGAGGIPIADRLSEAGKSVLLIEKGPASSGRWNGTMRPDWLDGSNLTRFDVPGLCNEIWENATGIACLDTDQMEGCVLGGGTAVNAGLWWRPNPIDWDYNFPEGWKSADMEAPAERVFSRIPGTTVPSLDGEIWLPEGQNVLMGGFAQANWTFVDANSVPSQKNRTYAHTPFMFSHGERGGPMATYLVTAMARPNFKLYLNTAVKRVIRQGGHITGVEVEPYLDGGYTGVINVTANTGRVILSAGTFGTAKILLRSGIGPTDQLQVVQNSTDGPTMINETEWINLPVGYNLDDHTNTDTVVSHPIVPFYDFYQAFNTPWYTDRDYYLQNRSGILAAAAPNIGPMFFEEILGADGIVRQLEWTARMEGSDGVPNGKAMTMSQYLGRGAVSRGRMTITPDLSTVVSTLPYLHDQNDIEAVITGIEHLQEALAGVANLTWNLPPANQTARDYVNTMVVSYSNRRANHWIGTSKMGLDDGTKPNGTAVVDTNTKVYGTDNLFVVDASVFPGQVTTNPSAYIVTVAEHASDLLLALNSTTSS